MPVRPKETFKRNSFISETTTTRAKNKIFVYAIFVVLLLELLSIFLVNTKDYFVFWYTILTNIIIIILVLQNLPKAKEMNFCKRKIYTYWALSLYYLVNILSFLLPLSTDNYITIVSYVLFGLTWLMMFLTLKEK